MDINTLYSRRVKSQLISLMEIKEVNLEPKRYLTVKKSITTSQITDKLMYDQAFRQLQGYIQLNQIAIAGYPAVLYFKWNDPEGYAEIGIAIPVSGVDTVKHSELSIVDSPASKAVMGIMLGQYTGLEVAHQEVNKYIAEHKLNYANFAIEEYVVDPMSEPDPEKWITKIYYFIKPVV